MANRKNSPRWADYKNRTRLKRKNVRYVPKWMPSEDVIVMPNNFSILRSRHSTVEFLAHMIERARDGSRPSLNMVSLHETDELTISILMAIMMDERNIFTRQYRLPSKGTASRKIFDLTHFEATVTKGNNTQNYFMSRTDKTVNGEYRKEIIDFAREHGIDDADSTLNPILVELFSNTNNHATEEGSKDIPWLVSIVVRDDRLCFSVIDLGMGIYESLKTNQALKNLPKDEFDVVENMYDNRQSKYLSLQIPKGIYSSTRLESRGQGLLEIYNRARHSTTCKKFVIITNKAMINLLNIGKIYDDTYVSFEGTSFYWEMER